MSDSFIAKTTVYSYICHLICCVNPICRLVWPYWSTCQTAKVQNYVVTR